MAKSKVNYRSSGAFKMAGTEKTYKYVVIFVSPSGRVGCRDLGNGCVRVRVEPRTDADASKMARYFPANNWKQYGQNGQPRFSIVIQSSKELKRVLAQAARALAESIQ